MHLCYLSLLLSSVFNGYTVIEENYVFKVFNTVVVHNKCSTNAVTKTLVNYSIRSSHSFSATFISTSGTVCPKMLLPGFQLALYSGTCSPEVGN